MGLIKNFLNKVIDKRIDEFRKGVGAQMQYNPLLVKRELNDNYNDKHLTRRLLENSVWYSGIEQDLEYFYRKQAPKFWRNGQESESINYFWAGDKDDIRKIHSGFPQLICEKMVDLLVGNGYEIKVEGKNEEELQETLDEMLADNMFKTLLAKSIETESWSGGVAWKMSWNPELTDYPIIEAWQPENYTAVIQSGRVIEDIFYMYYDKGSIKYRLSEIYGVDKKKGAYIDYKLEQLANGTEGDVNAKPKWVLASLADLEQTKDLKRIDFEGYYKRLSMYKANKLPNSEFRYSHLGESDYAGSYGAFDAIDEILSTWIQEFRDGKLHRYFPEELMLKQNGEYRYPSGFKKDHILTADSPSENMDKQKVQYSQGDLRVDKHIESYKVWMTQILNNSGLSPLTVGATGLEAINASEQSQQEREKVSIRTRDKKIGGWVEFLEPFLKTALELHLITENMTRNEDETYQADKVDDFDIIVKFSDYIIKSKNDRTLEVRDGLGSSWDIASAVKYVHDDMTPREQLALIARIKLEQGINTITQAELSALQAENMDINDELIEQGVEIVSTEVEQGGEVDADTTE